jgi:DNA repair protein RecN (Recombination protein N)
MLQSISIKNLAIVSELQLEFEPGMTALTGETGAGKSILIDALGLALGDKAERGIIRAGADKAEITAVFDVSSIPEAVNWLQDCELHDDNECHLRRIVTTDNRSKAFINNSPVPLKSLQALGSLLVEIHGQHAHQRLVKKSHQLVSLDNFANHNELVESVDAAFRQWHDTLKTFKTLKANEQDRASRLELLRFQASELDALNLQAGETARLEEQLKTLSNAETLLSGCFELSTFLYEDENSIHSQLSSVQGKMHKLVALNPALETNLELIESALINVQEASDNLRHFADSFDADEQTLAEIEARLQSIYDLSRKYRLDPEALCEKAASISDELAALENSDEELEKLEKQLEKFQQAYLVAADALTSSRQKAAKALCAETINLLKSLAMTEVRFSIDFKSQPLEKATRTGMDEIEFLVSANPGQPLAPLSKVASGGELSRISLAIQVATMSNMNIPTLIFDEVDVGIGGGTAEIVGRLLRQLGARQQALCVTHLPQVAAQAHNHMKVTKLQTENTTVTGIKPLIKEERVNEIARMLGGVEVTRQTLAHASEMIEKAMAS